MNPTELLRLTQKRLMADGLVVEPILRGNGTDDIEYLKVTVGAHESLTDYDWPQNPPETHNEDDPHCPLA